MSLLGYRTDIVSMATSIYWYQKAHVIADHSPGTIQISPEFGIYSAFQNKHASANWIRTETSLIARCNPRHPIGNSLSVFTRKLMWIIIHLAFKLGILYLLHYCIIILYINAMKPLRTIPFQCHLKNLIPRNMLNKNFVYISAILVTLNLSYCSVVLWS